MTDLTPFRRLPRRTFASRPFRVVFTPPCVCHVQPSSPHRVVQAAAHKDVRRGMVWLDDLETPEGRQRAEAISASLDGQDNIYDLFAVCMRRVGLYFILGMSPQRM